MSRRRRRTLSPMFGGIQFPQSISNSIQQYVDARIASTVVGSPVSQISSPFTRGNFYQQSTATRQPAISGSRLVFDGTSDCMDGSSWSGTPIVHSIPDGGNTTAGKGLTITGLFRLPDGTWLVGDFGVSHESQIGIETPAGAITQLSSDFSTVIQTRLFTSCTPALNNVGVQGVVGEVVAGVWDGTVWCSDANNDHIYHINMSTGEVLHDFTVANINALTNDTINNRLLIGDNTLTLKAVNKSTGVVSNVFTLFYRDANTIDQFFFDEDYGSAGALVVSCRDNEQPGRLLKYDLATAVPLKAWSVPSAQAIEQCYISGNQMWIANDLFFHTAGATNCVIEVPIEYATPDYGTKLVLTGKTKITDSTPAATIALLHGGDSIARKGVGLFYTTTQNLFRLIFRGDSTQATVDWPAATTVTTEFIYYILIDTVAHTATLWINGVLDSVETNAAITGSIPSLVWTICASYEGATGLPSRFCDATHCGHIVTTDTTHQTEFQAYWVG